MGWARRLIGLATSLVGLAPGAAITSDLPAESERERAASRQEPVGSGFAASGPGFYVWDEDPRQGRRWAEELGRPPALKDDYFG
jgi:hypothetical protein